MERDVRTLCHYCKMDYWYAGYRTKSVGSKYKEQCDKCCFRMGWTYVLIPPEKKRKL